MEIKNDDIYFMKQALNVAEQAVSKGEVPVAAVCVMEGKIIGSAHNQRESLKDPTAHAEIIAIRQASAHLNSWRLTDCTLFVTLEPCLMCAGAILNSRIARVVFGSYDSKAGALGSLYNVGSDPRLNHEFSINGGVLEDFSSKLLAEFFEMLRSY